MRLVEQSINVRQVAERRIYKRMKVKEFAFALLRTEETDPIRIKNMSMGEIGLAVYRSNPSKLGQIRDISMDGLAFRYISQDQHMGESSSLDILLADRGFYLENVSFNTISDFELEDETPWNTIRMRQRGVQFQNLSDSQKYQLEGFIRNYTEGEVEFTPFTW